MIEVAHDLYAELGGQFADALDPPTLTSDAALAEHARHVILRDTLDRRGVEFDQGDRPDLYVPDNDGGWKMHADAYAPDEARQWVARECRRSRTLAYFATHWAYTQNEFLGDDSGRLPQPQIIPAWPFIVAMLNAYDPPRDILIEKSRDMLASWLGMAAILHDLLFRPRWSVMTVSRVEDLVDDGGQASTIKTLHGKVRYMYERLPPFLRDAMGLSFKYLSIRNESTGAFVAGFSATPSAGRGPKWRRAFLDEFAWQPNSEEVMASVQSACPSGKALVSTPNGPANAFYRIRQLARRIWPLPVEEKSAHWQLLTIHWSQHPDRDRRWYEFQVATGSMTAEKVAQELDISYERSLSGRAYPRFSHQLHVAGGALVEVSTDYDQRRPLWVCMDFNHDPLLWEVVQPYASAPPFRVIAEICRRNAIYEDAINEFAVRFGARPMVEALFAAHPDWRGLYGQAGVCQAGDEGHREEVTIFGDATEEKSNLHNRMKAYGIITAGLKQYGFRVRLQVPQSNPPIIHRIETVNDALSKRMLVMDPRCGQLIRDFEAAQWNRQQSDVDQNKRDDDESGLTRSHASSALGYMLVLKHKVASSVDQARTVARAQDVAGLVRRW